MLIGINYVDVIPLENLRLIRGHSLFDGKYGLAVVANFHRNESVENNSNTSGLRELHLRSLTGKAFIFIHLVDAFIQSDLQYKLSIMHPHRHQHVLNTACNVYLKSHFLLIIVTEYFFLHLAEILKGGVKIAHNPLLCNVETIQWLDIVQDDRDLNLLGGTDPRCKY